jgi:hypothetical protein
VSKVVQMKHQKNTVSDHPSRLWIAVISQRAKALIPIFAKSEPRLIVEMIYMGLSQEDVEAIDEAFDYDGSHVILEIVNDELIAHGEYMRECWGGNDDQ